MGEVGFDNNHHGSQAVFLPIFESVLEPKVLIRKQVLKQISGKASILEIVRKMVKDNPKALGYYIAGKDRH